MGALPEAAVTYLVRKPAAALAPFVAEIWYFTGQLPHDKERIVPSGSAQLLVNLDEDELRTYRGEGYERLLRIGGAGLAGVHAEHFGIDTREQRCIVGVNFKPGGAYPFFNAPADATSGEHVELDLLWRRDGAVLRERLLEAGSPRRILDTLEKVLLDRLARPLEIDPAVAFAVDALERGVPVASVIDRLGSTPRRFIRHFTERVGLTPKRFARVRRFQRVLEILDQGKRVNWAEVAAATGYFDQAHLIHDFRAFAGVSPTGYRPRAPGAHNHMLID